MDSLDDKGNFLSGMYNRNDPLPDFVNKFEKGWEDNDPDKIKNALIESGGSDDDNAIVTRNVLLNALLEQKPSDIVIAVIAGVRDGAIQNDRRSPVDLNAYSKFAAEKHPDVVPALKKYAEDHGIGLEAQSTVQTPPELKQ